MKKHLDEQIETCPRGGGKANPGTGGGENQAMGTTQNPGEEGEEDDRTAEKKNK